MSELKLKGFYPRCSAMLIPFSTLGMLCCLAIPPTTATAGYGTNSGSVNDARRDTRSVSGDGWTGA